MEIKIFVDLSFTNLTSVSTKTGIIPDYSRNAEFCDRIGFDIPGDMDFSIQVMPRLPKVFYDIGGNHPSLQFMEFSSIINTIRIFKPDIIIVDENDKLYKNLESVLEGEMTHFPIIKKLKYEYKDDYYHELRYFDLIEDHRSVVHLSNPSQVYDRLNEVVNHYISKVLADASENQDATKRVKAAR